MIEDIIYGIIQTFTFIVFIIDVFVVITSNIRNAGKFIRFLRYLTYSITPVMYIIIFIIIWIFTEIFWLDYLFSMIMIFMLVIGCCIAYAEKFFTRKKKAVKSEKKRICTEKCKLCGKSGYTEELPPLIKKKG